MEFKWIQEWRVYRIWSSKIRRIAECGNDAGGK